MCEYEIWKLEIDEKLQYADQLCLEFAYPKREVLHSRSATTIDQLIALD